MDTDTVGIKAIVTPMLDKLIQFKNYNYSVGESVSETEILSKI